VGVYEEDDLEAHARAVEGAPAGTPQAGIPGLRDGDDTDTDSDGDSAPLLPPAANQSAPITSPTTEDDIIIKRPRARRQRDLGASVYGK
jgi:hypothetical protein